MRKFWAFLPGLILFATVAGATPITVSFDTVNPNTLRSEIWLTLTFTEVADGVSMFAALTPEIDLWDGWTFTGVWLEGTDHGKEMMWTPEQLQSAVLLSGYSFSLLGGRWFDARWSGPCEYCEEEPEREEQENPSPQQCEIVLREQFPTENVPDSGGVSLMLIGLGAVAFVRWRESV